MDKGILCGCDRHQEWMLPWWWNHYSKHNSYPVAFFDFGMSPEAKKWCEERGACFELPAQAASLPVSEKRQKKWEERFGHISWKMREKLFCKPFAFLATPFEKSLWIDLDCQVRGCVEPIFRTLKQGVQIGLKRESERTQRLDRKGQFTRKGEVNYNSGVVPFRKGAEILTLWTEEVMKHSHRFVTDQHALSRVLFRTAHPVAELPPVFNWTPVSGENKKALIYHFHGGQKGLILHTIDPLFFSLQGKLQLTLPFDPLFY